MRDCSVVIVSYNTRELTLRCLDALYAASPELSLEVIVVDNASSDGSVQAVRSAFAGVDVVENAQNLGFARAVNQGLRRASGRHLVLLNPDALVEAGSMAKLVEVLDGRPEIGAAGPLVLSPEGAPQHHSAARDLSLLGQFAWHFRLSRSRLHLGATIGAHGARKTERLSGSALAVRREVLGVVGLLDERFFMYFEDADWVLRIRRAGFLVCCVTEARVTHIQGASSRSDPLARSAHSLSSEIAYFEKHEGQLASCLLRLGIALSALVRGLTLDAWRACRASDRYRLAADLQILKRCLSP